MKWNTWDRFCVQNLNIKVTQQIIDYLFEKYSYINHNIIAMLEIGLYSWSLGKKQSFCFPMVVVIIIRYSVKVFIEKI